MAQKYIVGDVVMYDNKIMVVKEPRDGSHFDLSCPKEGLVYSFVGVDEIKPMLLTSAILLKNGWSKGQIYFRHSRIPRIKLCTDGGISWSVSINDDIIEALMKGADKYFYPYCCSNEHIEHTNSTAHKVK